MIFAQWWMRTVIIPYNPAALRDEAFIKIPILLAFLSVLFAATLVT
jgi:hypothetical protein